MKFTYVYLLVSDSEPNRHYVGLTDDLAERLARHNHGEVSHTARHRLWRIEVAVAFRERAKAAQFEKYLKSHSGRAFAKRHF